MDLAAWGRYLYLEPPVILFVLFPRHPNERFDFSLSTPPGNMSSVQNTTNLVKAEGTRCPRQRRHRGAHGCGRSPTPSALSRSLEFQNDDEDRGRRPAFAPAKRRDYAGCRCQEAREGDLPADGGAGCQVRSHGQSERVGGYAPPDRLPVPIGGYRGQQ